MDFSKVVGAQLLWSGAFVNPESGFKDTYTLFSDGQVVFFPDKESDQEPVVLDDGLDVLKQLVGEHWKFATAIFDLNGLLQRGLGDKNATDLYRKSLAENGVQAAPKGTLQTETPSPRIMVIDDIVTPATAGKPPETVP